jgi:sterol desaturase/sphingolipid hydroxylase (fatty acid hydroxylase superfamily)
LEDPIVNFFASVAAVTAVYVLVSGLERVPALQFRTRPSRRLFFATDAAWYGLAVLATAVSVYVFRPQLEKLSIRPIGRLVEHVPSVGQLLIALLIFDFVSFVVHRQLHRSDVLWNVHKVHHSTLALDGFATTRTHMFENLIRFVPPQAVLFLMGFPTGMVAPVVAIAAVYGISNHSNLGTRFKLIEPLLVTPRLHRRHPVPSTTQSNYGAIFTIWDRAFGTLLRLDTTDDERFGVPGELDTYPQHFTEAFGEPLRQNLARRGARATAAS